jgi:hypothetical protein
MYNTAFIKCTNLKTDFRTVFDTISWETEKKTELILLKLTHFYVSFTIK